MQLCCVHELVRRRGDTRVRAAPTRRSHRLARTELRTRVLRAKNACACTRVPLEETDA